MIKKQQKWVALLVLVTFAWLLQVSTMPLRASGTAAPLVSACSEMGPDYYEAVAQKAAPAKKKSILPLVLIGVGLVAVTAAVLFLFFLNKYDITGTWDFVFTHGGDTEELTTMFSGTKKSGSWSFVELPIYNGTYTVDGKKFTATITYPPTVTQFNGEFTGKDAMSGAWVIYGETWDWTATRGSAVTSLKRAPAAKAKPFVK